MKIFPQTISKERQIAADAGVEKITRKAALVIAFASVFIFFLKLLFF